MTQQHRPFLMGSETEFAVSGLRNGQLMDPEDVYPILADALKQRRAWVLDQRAHLGMYLQHGGRLYPDYGEHPEYATPECSTPREVALYDKAGEFLLGLAAQDAMAADANVRIRVLKNNLDPIDPDENTYGSHESYTCWSDADEVGKQILPHLATRVLYAGSGTLTGHEQSVGFELSQRARHLQCAEGEETTYDRAIYCSRIREGENGWFRAHLIGKDSQRAPFGIYLTYGVTGLLFEMINRGRVVGQGLTLADPVKTLHQVSHDPFASVQIALADNRKMTAIQVQACYLEECERAIQAGVLPDWAGEVIGHWRDTLTALERDPRRLADRLDPYCKLVLFERELARTGYDWSDLQKAVACLTRLRSGHGDRIVRAVLSENDSDLTDEERPLLPIAREAAMTDLPGQLDRLRFATRLQAIDLQYHELGGLYDRLHDAGLLKDVILTPADIEQASLVPPPGVRAAVRGDWIRRHRDPDWVGDWQFIWRPSTQECVDLRDPFNGEERVRTLQLPDKNKAWYVDVVSLLAKT